MRLRPFPPITVADRLPGGRRARRTRSRAAIALAAALIPVTAAAPAPAVATGSARAAFSNGTADGPADADPPFAETLTTDLVALMQRLRVPGAIVAVRTPQWGTWIQTLGTENLQSGAPIRAADHMRVGSITKTFTGTVILQLVQEGRLSLDDTVGSYLPDVPNGRNITIRQLLQMTSGLYNYSEDLEFNRALDERPQTRYTPADLLKIAFAHDPYFAPGCGYHYSNTNTILLGLLAEQLTGHPLAEEMQHRIFEPLGMHETSMPSDGTVLPAPYAHGYEFINNVDSLTAPVLTEKDAAWADWSAGNPKDVTHVNASWTGAAGEAISTVGDILRWAPALANGDLLSPELQRERLTFVPTTNPPSGLGYGLAIADFRGFLGHTGQISGYNSFEGHDPSLGASVVVLVNTNQVPDGAAPVDQLTQLVIADAFHH
ncbi:serine hydrolase domain-containing protein [Kitasatospora sp. NPDC002227]|uniref:serine hydrolase domain-containing protein n=1 Tax=Kitasatospora sp. NPDC002227 TaxID=3154773 RepID=UPI003322999D